MKRIAVVGTGISGLAAAYFLSRRHQVWLFEKERRLGGHTHTVLIPETEYRAATRYGCRVTTTTISEEQYRPRVSGCTGWGEAGSRITVLREDYRTLTGQFDKIVSIEMFEAVGLNHYDDYFGAVDRLLAPDGVMLLQTITVGRAVLPAVSRDAGLDRAVHLPGRGARVCEGDPEESLARDEVLHVSRGECRDALQRAVGPVAERRRVSRRVK